MLGIANQAHAALTIDSVTVNGGASTTVALGANITVVVTNSGNTKWDSTGWYIGISPPVTWQCDTGPSPSVSGNNKTYTFTITAPATAGTYHAYFRTSDNATSCAGTTSGTFTLADGVIVVGPPTVTSISPNTGSTAGGTAVTITGTNFTGATGVTIDGNACTPLSANTGTSITCTTPAGTAGAKNVVVTTPYGSGTGSGLFTYVVPPPTVTSISPNTGSTAGGTFVTINGANFTGATVYTIGGAPLTGVTVGATTITGTTPAGTAGAQNVVVTTPYGTVTGTGLFTYGAPPPTVTSISPNIGPTAGGTAVTITGTNFTGATAYTIGGASLTGVTVVNSTTITGTTPAGTVGAKNVVVTTPYGSGTGSGLFTYIAPPTVTTNAASGVTTMVATLNGTVSSNGAITTVTFDYGLTTGYGSLATTQSPLAANAVNAAVSADLIGLNCNTVFHYRVVANSSGGTTYGLDQTFTTGACVSPFPATACAATRYGTDLGCTANDVNLTNIKLAPESISSCVSGAPVNLTLDLTVNFASPNRYDVGIFIANDGKLPTLLPANGGAGSCSVDILPKTGANGAAPTGFIAGGVDTGTDTFPNLDGDAVSPSDICGDGSLTMNATGSGVKRMTNVTLPCYASPASLGQLFVPFAVSWDNQKSPIGGLCQSKLYPVPNTTSKCNAPLSTVSIAVVVLPVITKTNGGTQINPGANTTYTVTIFNNSGGTLLDMVFTDPVVTNLTVNSVSCAAAAGATCPATSKAAMQGAGISILSANLPNNSTLTFTINATVSPGAGIGSTITNTATATLTGGGNTSVSDVDLVVLAPSAAMSFSPATITEGATSVLTITLTNPTASPVTGVAFTDTYPSGVVNAGSAVTTCLPGATTTPTSASLELSGGTIPANGSCTVTVNVTSATACSAPCYVNSTGPVTTTSSGTISAASATLTVNAATFGAFNACDDLTDPNALCTNTTTSTNSRISTKIAGTAFFLDLVALKSDGTWNSSYGSNVIVELLDSRDNSGALDAYNCRSSWTTISQTLTPNPSFASSNGQITTGGSFTVPEAYRDVRVRVTNASGSFKQGCSTDNFAIRPNSLTVIPTDGTWETYGTTNLLTNTDVDVSGGVVHKAGQPFTVTATAYKAVNVPFVNYAGTTPISVLSVCSPGTACTASLGSLGIFALGNAVGGAGGVGGVVTWNSATYSEVGAFDLTLQDTDFTSVDAGDTAASCAGRYVCGTVSVGRFVPDHFGITGLVVTRSDLQTTEGQATPFTYMDEPMLLNLEVTAYNANDVKTNNYAGNFAKLNTGMTELGTGSNWFNTGCTGSTQCMGLGAVNGATGLSSRLLVVGAGTYASVGDPSSSWFAGVGTFTANVKLARNATPDGPYDILKIGAKPLDSDGVTVPPISSTDTTHCVDLDVTTGTESAACTPGATEANLRRKLFETKVRFGRLWLGNACGSEKRELTIPFRTEYWNGNVFITNSGSGLDLGDSLTSIASANIGLGNHQPTGFDARVDRAHIPTGPFVVVNGQRSFALGMPSGMTMTAAGSVDIVFGLGPDATTDTSFNFSTAPHKPTAGANMPYLRGQWFGTGYTRDPVARAAFGIYCGGGSGRGPIYIRESY